MHAPAVHQHAVQAVQVARGAVGGGRQVLAVAGVQVQLLVELVPVVDLLVGLQFDNGVGGAAQGSCFKGGSRAVTLSSTTT